MLEDYGDTNSKEKVGAIPLALTTGVPMILEAAADSRWLTSRRIPAYKQ